MVLYSGGIPGLAFGVLYKYREAIRYKPVVPCARHHLHWKREACTCPKPESHKKHIFVTASYGFLFSGYKQEGLAPYWEIMVVTVRKFLLLSVTIAMKNLRLEIQTVCALMILFLSTLLQLAYSPYDAKIHDRIELWSLTVGEITLFLGLFFQFKSGSVIADDDFGNMIKTCLTVTIVAINGGFAILFGCYMVRGILQMTPHGFQQWVFGIGLNKDVYVIKRKPKVKGGGAAETTSERWKMGFAASRQRKKLLKEQNKAKNGVDLLHGKIITVHEKEDTYDVQLVVGKKDVKKGREGKIIRHVPWNAIEGHRCRCCLKRCCHHRHKSHANRDFEDKMSDMWHFADILEQHASYLELYSGATSERGHECGHAWETQRLHAVLAHCDMTQHEDTLIEGGFDTLSLVLSELGNDEDEWEKLSIPDLDAETIIHAISKALTTELKESGHVAGAGVWHGSSGKMLNMVNVNLAVNGVVPLATSGERGEDMEEDTKEDPACKLHTEYRNVKGVWVEVVSEDQKSDRHTATAASRGSMVGAAPGSKASLLRETRDALEEGSSLANMFYATAGGEDAINTKAGTAGQALRPGERFAKEGALYSEESALREEVQEVAARDGSAAFRHNATRPMNRGQGVQPRGALGGSDVAVDIAVTVTNAVNGTEFDEDVSYISDDEVEEDDPDEAMALAHGIMALHPSSLGRAESADHVGGISRSASLHSIGGEYSEVSSSEGGEEWSGGEGKTATGGGGVTKVETTMKTTKATKAMKATAIATKGKKKEKKKKKKKTRRKKNRDDDEYNDDSGDEDMQIISSMKMSHYDSRA
jgi:hypothetical protein